MWRADPLIEIEHPEILASTAYIITISETTIKEK
jgi:hypothetical protein